jgi:hypothetical protein
MEPTSCTRISLALLALGACFDPNDGHSPSAEDTGSADDGMTTGPAPLTGTETETATGTAGPENPETTSDDDSGSATTDPGCIPAVYGEGHYNAACYQ